MKNRDEKQNSPTQSEIIDSYIKQLEKKDKKQKHKKHRPSFTRRLRIVLSVAIALLVALAGFLLYYFDIVNPLKWFETGGSNITQLTEFSSESLTEPDLQATQSESADASLAKPQRPSKMFSVTLSPDKDFSLSATKDELLALTDEISTNGFTTIFVNFNSDSNLFTETEQGRLAFENLSAAAKEKALSVYGVLDVTILAGENICTAPSTEYITKNFGKMLSLEGLDGIMLSGVEYSGNEDDFKNYIAMGTLSGFKDYRQNLLNKLVQALSTEARKKAPSKLLGLITDGVYATKEVLETGLDATADTELLRDKNADVLLWMEKGLFDIVFARAQTTTYSDTLPFEAMVKWWSENTPVNCDIGFILSSDLALKAEGDWKNPDQLGRQLKILNEINRYVFCFNSFSDLKSNTTGSTELVYKYLTGEVEEDYIMRELSITSPAKSDFTTYENSIAFIGASDPNFPLLLNGKEAERTKDGYFSLQLDLKVGSNKFTFEHKGTIKSFNVNYRYVVIKSYTPSSALKQDGGAAIMVTVLARRGSTVKAVLNGETYPLEMTEEQAYSDFAEYKGIVTLPEAKEQAVSLGNIKFVGTHNGVSESFYGGKITVNKKPEEPSSSTDGELPPNSGGYMAVGNKLIAEVTKYQIETFDGDKINDLSQPYNSYLPKGTLDYCSESTIYDSSSGNTYRLLGYGKRVYTTSKGVANIRTMRGSLPSKNKLSLSKFTYEGSHTTLTLKTEWRSPFKLEISPQKYASATGSARGTISSATFNYVDITFCYATGLDIALSEIANSPVFSRAQIIKNTADYTLRLYLKKTGAFYGWTADYNSDGDLVFKFLNPKKATKADNKYGGRLDGIKIVVDPGHGGSDPGAVGNHKTLTEAERSLTLSKMLKSRLESLGATVIMTRTTDKSLTSDERILVVRNNNPDLAVSVHRNAADDSSARGFSAHYFNAYTKAAADKIKNATSKSGTYTKYDTKWHVFYMSRISNCPVVLTENGFMSNSNDFANIKDNAWNEKCADAIVKGVVDYFLSIG
ncbi:MAG: N-acetylmuramoyl-L-alanine amidase [Ruminococcaceae bacterium]|nr:N-acetylmuramoyl-L-alanine amidase [Oscillospiraceae bacterium]